jgi:hypothetical protein
VWFVRSPLTFRKNSSPPCSGPKNKSSKKVAEHDCRLLIAGLLFGLLFDSDAGGDMLLRMSVDFY